MRPISQCSPSILSRRPLDVSAVYDIETQNWDTFVVGGYYDGITYRVFSHTNERDLVDTILNTSGKVWAHFGGRFDHLWLLSHIAKRGLPARITLAGSRIVACKIGDTTLCDSFAVFPMTLEKLTTGFGVSKSKLELPCRCGKQCGGYCSIKQKMPQAERAQLLHYLELDCKSLWTALANFDAYCAAHDLDLGITIGSSAMRNAIRLGNVTKNALSPPEWNFARLGYHGGRCQVIKPYMASGYSHDIRSSYPYEMANGVFPSGEYSMCKSFPDSALSIVHATVAMPEQYLPSLPVLAKSQRQCFPFGRFAGIWPSDELHYAISLGAKIDKIHAALVWSNSTNETAEWTRHIFTLRERELINDTPIALWLKLYANSLSGKFGARADHETIEHATKVRYCKASNSCINGAAGGDCGQCCEVHCSGACGSHLLISNLFYSRFTFRIESSSRPELAAFITARARVHLSRELLAADSPAYCDTDSVHAVNRLTGARDKHDAKLGDMICEGAIFDAHYFAPKVYTYIDNTGTLIGRAKGIKHGDASAIVPGAIFNSAGVCGLRSALCAGKVFARQDTARKLTVGTGDRLLVNSDDTRAPKSGVDFELFLRP